MRLKTVSNSLRHTTFAAFDWPMRRLAIVSRLTYDAVLNYPKRLVSCGFLQDAIAMATDH